MHEVHHKGTPMAGGVQAMTSGIVENLCIDMTHSCGAQQMIHIGDGASC